MKRSRITAFVLVGLLGPACSSAMEQPKGNALQSQIPTQQQTSVQQQSALKQQLTGELQAQPKTKPLTLISPYTKNALLFAGSGSFVGGCIMGFKPSIRRIGLGSVIALISYFLGNLTVHYGLKQNEKTTTSEQTTFDKITNPLARRINPGILKVTAAVSFGMGVTTGLLAKTFLWPLFALFA